LNPGIEHWFSSRADAVIGYVAKNRTRVVAGGPVCDVRDLARVTEEFEAAARTGGERVCYFGAEGRIEALYLDDPNHSLIPIGALPSWDPARWAERVERRGSLRAQFNRARNKGVTAAEWASSRAMHDPALARCLAQWLETRGLPPLHFLVEPETLQDLRDRRVFVATRAEVPVAFLVASPVPNRAGWLIEQFVRGADSPNGTVELMIDVAVRALAADRARYVTLGLAPLSRRAGVPKNTPAWLRLVSAWARAHGRRFYNFDGLDSFKAKFNPERWDVVYALSNEPRFSVGSLYAVAAAFSGGSPIQLTLRGMGMALLQELRWLGHRNGRT
jgi:phosphatidylglycerol lysyltransferase